MPRTRIAFRGVPARPPSPPTPPAILPAEEIIRLFGEMKKMIENLDSTTQDRHLEMQKLIENVQESVGTLPDHTELIEQNHQEALGKIGEIHTKLDDILLKEGPQGEPGVSPDVEQIIQQVLARMPVPEKGKDADAETIATMVLSLLPEQKLLDEDKLRRRILKEVKKLMPAPIAKDEIVQEVLKQVPQGASLKIEHIEGLDTKLSEIRNHVATTRGGGDTVVAGSGVTITNTVNGNKRISAAVGASIANEAVTAVQSGDNVTIDLTQLSHTFQSIILVLRNQIPQTLNNTYTIAGNIITIPGADAGEIFGIVYTYA